MYLKRTSKLLDLSVPSQITADVRLRDLTCPICRGILIEPVTLPCTHNLCLGCLKGTFEHNSLNCPLCRVRVGSWLRTATKSETLVNNDLWDFIRAKFPKEVERKHHGEEGDLDLDSDYAPNRILSTAGEIHREYEMQRKQAEEEMRRQRQAEQMASEALIQKIQAEQQLLLAQLAQDELLAKSLAKQQVMKNQKAATKCYNECLNTSISSCAFDTSRFNTKNTFVNNVKALQTRTVHLEDRQTNSLEDVRDGLKRQTNIERLPKIEAIYSKVYNSNETNASNVCKNRVKYCCQKQIPIYNAVTKTLKQQTVSKFIQPCTSNYTDPGCSTSRAYTETKEELHVPNDVVNNKKKSLGIEICMTLADNDERIGSAESSGSHDSINQEIHHFKPIRAAPRTKLKISTDGKLIDPKLIRVIPILKKVSDAVPKPPSPTYVKRIIGCSWSAFRGSKKQDVKKKQSVHDLEDTKRTLIDQNSSTSPLDYSLTVSNKLITKIQTNDAIRRLDFMPELSSFDGNKNYPRNTSKIVNDTKVGKKISDNELDVRKAQKSWKRRTKNNMVTKYKRYRNLRNIKKGTELILNATDEEENNSTDLNSSFGETSLQNNEQNGNDNITVDNTMEEIKKKRENTEEEMLISETQSNRTIRSKTIRNKVLFETRNKSPTTNQILLSSSRESTKLDGNSVPYTENTQRTKHRKISGTSHNNANGSEKSELSKDASSKIIVSSLRKSTRNLTKISSKVDNRESNSTHNKSNSKLNRDSLSTSCDETEECVQENNHIVGKHFSDKEVIEEQQRIERLLLQEREDLEFARRLQAQFDEMEWISGRTRRSKKATENVKNEVDSRGVDSAMRIVYSTSKTRETSKRKPIANQIVSTTAKRKLGRPPKCVKVTLQTCKNESGAR